MTEFLNVPLGPVLTLGVVVGTVVVFWWLERRDTNRILRESHMRDQLREMEQAISEERLPEEARERRRQDREEQAEIRREARRRLGLPEEE
jgi:hypothetical protein